MNIVLLDDHILFSNGINNLLSTQLSGSKVESYSSIESLRARKKGLSDIDILISDLELVDEDIFDFFTEVRAFHKNIPILVVSMHNKLSVIKKCLEFKVEGYILKDDTIDIVSIVNRILNGKTFYSNKVEDTLKIDSNTVFKITPREEEIIKLISKGKSKSEILTELFISTNTYKTHKKNIFRKLDINSLNELMKYYYDNYI